LALQRCRSSTIIGNLLGNQPKISIHSNQLLSNQPQGSNFIQAIHNGTPSLNYHFFKASSSSSIFLDISTENATLYHFQTPLNDQPKLDLLVN
jgi:hypothetical protein